MQLNDYLRAPSRLAELDDQAWDILLRQAQATRLHGSLACLASDSSSLSPVIDRALRSARVVADANQRAVRWELKEIKKVLAPLGVPLIALKGAAYVLHNANAACGRFVTDIDILVPRAQLAKVEDKLKFAGYISSQHNAYDQRYYRRWMHELPPMQHMQRGTSLDVHHHILPLTARANPSIDLLLKDLVQAGDGWQTLNPVDMIIHSITHLFFDGEWDHALRDLFDIDRLLRQYADDDSFWPLLLNRAEALDLLTPVQHALPVVEHFFQTPIPALVIRQCRRESGERMQATFIAAAKPNHASCRQPRDAWARRALFIRGHYLRMPLPLLLPHLARKAFRRDEDERRDANK